MTNMSRIDEIREQLKDAERELLVAQHEDGGLYSHAKWRVDELKVKLFDAVDVPRLLSEIDRLTAELHKYREAETKQDESYYANKLAQYYPVNGDFIIALLNTSIVSGLSGSEILRQLSYNRVAEAALQKEAEGVE